MSLTEYMNEFKKRLYKVKNYDAQMSGDFAYRLLKNANLKQNKKQKKQLIKATISDLMIMKEQLKEIFSDLLSPSCNTMLLPGKSETEDVLYIKSQNNRYGKRTSSIQQTKKKNPQPFSYQKPQKGKN